MPGDELAVDVHYGLGLSTGSRIQRSDVQVGELRALAHPMRQRILRRLHQAGPATSATLARPA